MSHIPSSFIRGFEFALQLLRGHAFLSRADHIDREKPLGKRQMRIVEYGSSRNGKLVTAIDAFIEIANLIRLTLRLKLKHAGGLATNAINAVRKTDIFKVFNALFFRIELGKMLENRRLFVGFVNSFCHSKEIVL